VGVDHYENFPVASVLCPPALRPAVAAIYWFARTADDIADEGDASAPSRLADLSAFRHDLVVALDRGDPGSRWPQVFAPLLQAQQRHGLPPGLLHDLISAFEQDVHNPPYPDRASLLDYCSRSANPVGRLLLHLYGVGDAQLLQRSDAICSALQLINFWQDLGRDQRKGRNYLPASDLAGQGLHPPAGRPIDDSPALRQVMRELCSWARTLMLSGAPLVRRVPGRAGWELRLVVQGGLRILEKIEQIDHATMLLRPTLGRSDLPLLAWRALRMSAGGAR